MSIERTFTHSGTVIRDRERKWEKERTQITASHLLSVKGDNGEDQNQHAYIIINLGYYSSLETAADLVSLLVVWNTSRAAIWGDTFRQDKLKHRSESQRVATQALHTTAMSQFEDRQKWDKKKKKIKGREMSKREREIWQN